MNIEKSDISILMGVICVANIKYNTLHPLSKEYAKLSYVPTSLGKGSSAINLKLHAVAN